MYAIKANTNLAVRAILHQECAGGDCFSEGEIHATFKAGAEADKIALNGGNKPEICLRIAVEKGITINIDAESEIDRLREICRSLDKQARVNIRLKPLSDAYNQTPGDYFGGDHLADYVRRTKWGFSVEKARELINRIRSFPLFDLSGFSCHIGRITRDPLFFHHYGRAVGGMVTELHGLTGFAPRILDIGGGWARERDPESKSLATNTTPAEVSARATCGQILTRLEASGLDVPELWVEPGRFIVGNASVLLATVGTVKHDLGLTWVHIDASTNDLPRIDTSGSAYHVLAASGMLRKFDGPVDVVGPICIDSTMGRDIHMPEMVTGEPVAILDAGMYSESASTQFNSIPRPATVLVNGQTAEIIKEREQISDIFRHHRIPERLL
jgi:diaminopimelate decarboxylase